MSDRIVRESTLPLAPLHDQRRIARLLDVATTLCARRRCAVRRLAELRGSVLAAMTVRDHGDLTRSCSLDSLIAAGDRINYGVVQPGDHVEGGVPLIRAGDIRAGRVQRERLKTISPSVDAAYSRSRIVGNEVLVTCVGSVGLVAVTTPEDVGSNVVRAIARVPIESVPLRAYVAAYLETVGVQRYFASELRTVAQPTLNIKQIRELEVPIPTGQSLERFHRVSSTIDRHQEAQVAHLAILDELFASVQHRPFAGAI